MCIISILILPIDINAEGRESPRMVHIQIHCPFIGGHLVRTFCPPPPLWRLAYTSQPLLKPPSGNSPVTNFL